MKDSNYHDWSNVMFGRHQGGSMFKAPPPVGGFDGGKPFELFGKEDEDVGESWPKGPRDQGTKGPQMVFTIHRWFSHKQWVEFDRPCTTDGKVFDFFEDLKALQVAALF